jgi:hypothetical protein
VQPELEPGRNTEVAAAADRPEEIGTGLGLDPQEPAIGGHHLGGQQVIGCGAVLADEVADPDAGRLSNAITLRSHTQAIGSSGRQARSAVAWLCSENQTRWCSSLSCARQPTSTKFRPEPERDDRAVHWG